MMKNGTKESAYMTIIILLVCLIAFASGVSGQRSHDDKDAPADTQWEYLIVAGGNVNLSTAGNENYPNMRKQPDSAFGREAFPLERNMDKLGAKGWELVSVYGQPNDPVYYFKRLKQSK
jgi:hypothetical protein